MGISIFETKLFMLHDAQGHLIIISKKFVLLNI